MPSTEAAGQPGGRLQRATHVNTINSATISDEDGSTEVDKARGPKTASHGVLASVQELPNVHLVCWLSVRAVGPNAPRCTYFAHICSIYRQKLIPNFPQTSIHRRLADVRAE